MSNQPLSSRSEKLKQIHEEVVNLTSSPLYQYRVEHKFLPVVGEGNYQAGIMFVAEAPGINEAKTGRHFQGQAGKIFDQLINATRLTRSEIYITNIIKDKLPQNRNPLPDEIKTYAPFLIRQIKIIQPKIIVTLGKFSTNFLLELCHKPIQPLTQIHGALIKINCSYGTCHHVPMFHPAAALYNKELFELMKHDFFRLKNQINRT